MMQKKSHSPFIIFVLLLALSHPCSASNYELLNGRPYPARTYTLNGCDVQVVIKTQKDRHDEHVPVSIALNGTKILIAEAEVIPTQDLFRIFSIDLNGDGFADLAYNHRNGTNNRYYYYFLHDPAENRYVSLGEHPELIIKQYRLDGDRLFQTGEEIK